MQTQVRILSPNPRKVMTNGLFVGRIFLENIKCMKWESQDEKRCDFVGVRNQEYIIMQNNVEFETTFQIHRNRTCCHKLPYTMECIILLKERDL
jgi:hypothetical protein